MTPAARPWRIALAATALALLFVVYGHSFNTFPILERRHSVLAEADAAAFAVLHTEFALTRHYGDEYRPSGRTSHDIAQKHKTHHFLYFVVGGVLYEAIAGFRSLLGLDRHQALYEVTALLGVLNVILLGLLLRHFAPSAPRVAWLALYAVALGTWIYHAIPESWPLSTTLALGFLLLAYQRRWSTPALAGYLGLAMLNNFLLGTLGLILLLRELSEREWRAAVSRTAVAAAIVVGTWLTALSLGSLIEPGLRPDRFVAYTLWFKRHLAGQPLPLADPYVWASAFTNLFVNPVVSRQPDPVVPQEALLSTLRGGWQGPIAVAAYVALAATAAVGAWRTWRATGWPAILRDEAAHLAAFCAAFALFVSVTFFGGAFLYSMLVVPLVVVLGARYLPAARWAVGLLYATVAIVAVNNAMQIVEFRAALRAMG
jgi:hypothetical protein